MHSELSIKKMFSKLNVFVIALFVGFSIQSSSAHTYKTGECPTVEPMGDFNMKKVCSLCRLLRIPQHFVYRIEIEHIPEPTTCLISLCRSSKGQFCLYIFGFPTSAHNMCVVYSNILRKRYNTQSMTLWTEPLMYSPSAVDLVLLLFRHTASFVT